MASQENQSQIGEDGTFTIPEVTIRPYPTIRKGSRGEAVAKWQRIIGVAPDGNFGSGTETATKTWQAAHGLTADGVVGPATWQKSLEPMSVAEMVNVELGPTAPGAAPLPGGVPNSVLPPQFIIPGSVVEATKSAAAMGITVKPAVTEAGMFSGITNLPWWAKLLGLLGIGYGVYYTSEQQKRR
jgi:putative peptidoglycan binding protein